MKLYQYVNQNAIRGACTCGRCIDAGANPEERQPKGHTIDMAFFKVAKRDGANKEDFLALVEADFPHWLDGEEHNYISMGAEIGDQGIAIMCIGLGDLLGAWRALTPVRILGSLPDDIIKNMAGEGMLSMRRIDHGD